MKKLEIVISKFEIWYLGIISDFGFCASDLKIYVQNIKTFK
jgi:hypothetical protein